MESRSVKGLTPYHLLEVGPDGHLIGQAQGILMERFGLSADQSFAVLRRYSQDNNVKLRNVAERIIETRRLPGTPPTE
jgi:hypothetical protein